MTRYGQADLVAGCLTVNHAKDRSRGYKLKKCSRCEGAGDDQNEFNVRADHDCLVRHQSAVLGHLGLLHTVVMIDHVPQTLGSVINVRKRI